MAKYYCEREIFFLVLMKIYLIACERSGNYYEDLFYNVDFAGPLFNEAVYTIYDLPVSTKENTAILSFTVNKKTSLIRPSYYNPTSYSCRQFQEISPDITVKLDNSNFVVDRSYDKFSLRTNGSLNYFVPFHRYVFNLIAIQTFPDRLLPVISKAIVQITLKNDNKHAPYFIPNNPLFYIAETTPANTEIGTIFAIDDDNDGIEYSISDGYFSIDRFNGILRLEKDFLSLPWMHSISLNVTATDDGASCSWKDVCLRKSNFTIVNITIIRENRHSPYFSGNTCEDIFFKENIPINTALTSITVVDNDQGKNGNITISFPSEKLQIPVSGLRNPAYSDFSLNLMNQINSTRIAVLNTTKTFDYDEPGATRVWFVNIIANDHGTPSRQALCFLRINLVDVNDNAPEFLITSWETTIYKSSTSGKYNSRILHIIAFDADSDKNGEIKYYIGTRSVPFFNIEKKTGMIILEKDPASFNSSDIHQFPITFHVYAYDSGTPSKPSINNATVTIFYSNNSDLVMGQWINQNNDEIHINISEKFYELYPNRPVFQDGIFDGTISYELTSQIPSILTVSSPLSRSIYLPFRELPIIKNGTRLTSGIIVTSGLHSEIEEKYFLSFRVLTDPPLINSIFINLIDENDQIPTFGIRSFVSSILENENGFRILAHLRAFDCDIIEKNHLIHYKLNTDLSDEKTIEYFHVELNGTIWTNRIFRKEDNRIMYRLFITAYNKELLWNSTKQAEQDFQFDVQIISKNKNSPKFQNSLSIISINETITKQTIILNLTIIDEDIDTTLNLGILYGNIRNAFTFTLLSDNSNDDKRTKYEAIGQLKVIGSLDYEFMQNYTLILYAFDTKNVEKFQVIVNLQSENTKAPTFQLLPDFGPYPYQIIEGSSELTLRGPLIHAIDWDLDRPSLLVYEIYDPHHQLNLTNVFLNQNGYNASIGINSSGLSSDLPFGSSTYRFGIRATDENGKGVSSYAEASINVIDINNKIPIPIISTCIPEGINSTISIDFIDPDDATLSTIEPYITVVVSPTNFKLRDATFSDNRRRLFEYHGTLNRSLTKNFTVILNVSDSKYIFGIRTFSIIVCDQSNIYPIFDGSKTIKIIYVQGYENSLRNTNLGSVYVQDLNDWFRANRSYTIKSISNNQIINIIEGNLYTPNILNRGSLNISVNVIKSNIGSAISTIQMDIETVDSEYVRNALAIRICGEYPETMLGNPLDRLHQSLSSLLKIRKDLIIILTVRPVFRYQTPYDPPKSLDQQKLEALTDVVFYIVGRERFEIKRILKDNLNQFQSNFQINVVEISPDPCQNHGCPQNTHCRATRTIHPRPNVIDANVTAFIGINILDSADCVALPTDAQVCSSVSLLSDGENSSFHVILETIFGEENTRYAEYDGTLFSNLSPTRFSFDFLVSSLPTHALLLLYGRNSTPIDDFFWIAIEIIESKLKFHFHNQSFLITHMELNISTWYHVECQFIHSIILISINDYQHYFNITDNINENSNLSSVRLYLGGVPMNNSLIAQLYPALKSINNFTGRIRNVVSNGCYLNMLINDNTSDRRLFDINVPWYTWLIIVLVLLILATILVLSLLTCLRRKQQMKELRRLYTDGTGENIINYKDTAGEEDHFKYNLHILKKPIYSQSDSNLIPTITRSEYIDPRFYYRSSLGEYIQEKLHENIIPYANDTQLHYLYEGEGSLASNLSSLESPLTTNENHSQYFLSPIFENSPTINNKNDILL